MTPFTESECAALLAGLRHIQDRLTARRIAPDSVIGKLLTKDGAYSFPTADDLVPLIDRLTEASVTAPESAEPPPRAIEAVIRLVLLHPTAVFTAEAMAQMGYANNLPRYVDQMLADSNEEALISQEVLLVTAPRPLTEEEHEVMYGDLPYPHPTKEKED